MHFELSPRVKEYRSRLELFMERHIYPAEEQVAREMLSQPHDFREWKPIALLEDLKTEARKQDLWNLFLPDSEFGAGYRQYGGSYPVWRQRSERAVAQTATGRRDPVGLRDDRARGGLLRRNEYPDPYRS